MPDEFTVEAGVIIPAEPNQYQYGEQYITCSRCGTKRPKEALELRAGAEYLKAPAVQCVDRKVCESWAR